MSGPYVDPYYIPPPEIATAARDVLRWAANKGFQDWQICGLGLTGPLRHDVERLRSALMEIRFSGNNSNPHAIWMQKVAAHALEPDQWPKPGPWGCGI